MFSAVPLKPRIALGTCCINTQGTSNTGRTGAEAEDHREEGRMDPVAGGGRFEEATCITQPQCERGPVSHGKTMLMPQKHVDAEHTTK